MDKLEILIWGTITILICLLIIVVLYVSMGESVCNRVCRDNGYDDGDLQIEYLSLKHEMCECSKYGYIEIK